MFLKISQNWQENTCARFSFLIRLQDRTRFSFLIRLRTPFLIEHVWWLLLSKLPMFHISSACMYKNSHNLRNYVTRHIHKFVDLLEETGSALLSVKVKIVTITLHKKWSFPLRIFSVNVTKPQFPHIYWRNPDPADFLTFTEEILNEKLHFLCSVTKMKVTHKS